MLKSELAMSPPSNELDIFGAISLGTGTPELSFPHSVSNPILTIPVKVDVSYDADGVKGSNTKIKKLLFELKN